MSPQESLKAFWNARYAEGGFAYGTAPNDFLVEHVRELPARQPVLCLADGEGRNGVWLARRGFDVTSADLAERGLEKAQALAREAAVQIRTLVADVTRHDLGEATWGGIVSIFLHLPARSRRALHERCVRALIPGGLILYESYGQDQLRYKTGGPPEQRLLARLDEVLTEFDGCEIVHRFDGVREVNEGRLHHGPAHVIQLVVRKPVA